MGLIDKLNYLKETKKMLVETLGSFHIPQYQPFRTQVEELRDEYWTGPATVAFVGLNYMHSFATATDSGKKVTDEISEHTYDIGHKAIIGDRQYYAGSGVIPSCTLVGHGIGTSYDIRYVQFATPNDRCTVNIRTLSVVNTSPDTINFPNKYRVCQHAFSPDPLETSILRDDYETRLLSRGIIWRNCTYCHSTWFFTRIKIDHDVNIICVDPITVSTYFSMFHLSVDTIVGIIDKLAVDTTGTCILSIGAHNVNKLTEAQLNVAYEKGWTVQ